MSVAEDKVLGLAKYAFKRMFKIAANAGSKEAREMRAKRKAYKKENKEFAKENPFTGNGVKNA